MHLLLALTLIPSLSQDMPNKEPQLAAHQNTVALVFGSGRSVMFAKSIDAGDTFTKPVQIADVPKLMLNRHRGPRVAFSGKTLVVSAIGAEEGNLLSWRSTDGGSTWSKAVPVNDAPSSAKEGLHAMVADEQGNLAMVWLDLRDKGTRLYGAISKDAGATWSPNFVVYESPEGTICQCCHPSLLALGGGEFAVMFRNVLGGNRDMYVLKIRDGKVTGAAQNAGTGHWPIQACPMDGGGMALSKGQIVTAWRRDQEVFLSSNGETRLGAGKDITLAASGQKVFAVWNEAGAIQSYVSGKTEQLSKEGTFPNVIALPDGSALAAWEERGGLAFRKLR